MLDGLSSQSDNTSEKDASENSFELDLEQIGEAPTQERRVQNAHKKMQKLRTTEPVLKREKDFCHLGLVKASQRLSFAIDGSDSKFKNFLKVPSSNTS